MPFSNATRGLLQYVEHQSRLLPRGGFSTKDGWNTAPEVTAEQADFAGVRVAVQHRNEFGARVAQFDTHTHFEKTRW